MATRELRAIFYKDTRKVEVWHIPSYTNIFVIALLINALLVQPVLSYIQNRPDFSK
jgi:hypothetical protein